MAESGGVQGRRGAAVGDVVTPGEAAKRLSLATSTLRIYSVRLAAVLSTSARGNGGGRRGVRTYTREDLDKLGRAKGLLGRGLTYGEVAAELSREEVEGEEAVGPVARAGAVPAADCGGSGDLRSFSVMAAKVLGVAEAWQRLAAERESEVIALRERVRSLEVEVKGLKRQVRHWAWPFGTDRS